MPGYDPHFWELPFDPGDLDALREVSHPSPVRLPGRAVELIDDAILRTAERASGRVWFWIRADEVD